MATTVPQLGERERATLDRVVAVAEADPRFVGIALVGSRASGKSDAFSDMDLVFAVEDEAYDAFIRERDEVLGSVERLLWSESWSRPESWFFIFANGVEGDLSVVRASEAASSLTGPFVVVWERRGVFSGAEITALRQLDPSAGRTVLERTVRGFWHEFGHLTKALGRNQLWWASGQLEVVRGMCVNLLRLTANFDDPEVGDEPYWKVELTLDADTLDRLRPTLSGLDRTSMVAAAGAALDLFCELAEPLAQAHDLEFPRELAELARAQLALIDG